MTIMVTTVRPVKQSVVPLIGGSALAPAGPDGGQRSTPGRGGALTLGARRAASCPPHCFAMHPI